MKVMARLNEKIMEWLSDKRLHLCLVVVFCIIMAIEYVSFVYNQYCYMGFDYTVSPDSVTIGLLFLAISGLALFANRKNSSFLYLTGICLAVFLCIPSAIMYIFGSVSAWCPLYSTLLLLLIIDNQLRIPPLRIKHIGYRWQIITLAFAVVMLTIPFAIKYGLPTNLKVFGLGSEVYDVRAAANEKANPLISYLFSPFGKVLLPTLLIMGFLHKDLKIIALSIVVMLYLFMVNPHKSLLFSIPVAIAFVFFKRYETKTGAFLLMIDIVLIISVMARVVMDNVLPESILVRRGFFLPTLICDKYFCFFDNNPMTLSHSIMRVFQEYPYEWEPSHLMGFVMHEMSETSCNTGIIADGFMNFGHIGVLLWIVLTVLIFKYIDSIGIRSAYFGLVFIFLYTLTNSALLTSMLTHGGILLLLVLTFLVDRVNDGKTVAQYENSLQIS